MLPLPRASMNCLVASAEETFAVPSGEPIPRLTETTLAGMLASGKPAKDARAYLYIGPSTRISPLVSAPGERPHARSEITIEPLTTFAR
ncbi:hypothetical protein ACSD7O_19505 [Methylorubrum extorquens]|uniref:hypothetical protein n=1 Tax=Methylorubrum extorquens TaxID=408 RepID=UPI003F643089